MIKTIEDWNSSEDGDGMTELAAEAGVDLKTLTRVKVEQAKLVEHLMKDERSINALRVAERFADGEATREELDEATDAAYAASCDSAYADATDADAAAYAAADAASADAAYAAAYAAAARAAAYAAAYAADADAYTAYAAYAAAYADADAAAAAYAADAAAYNKTLKQCADICRKYIDSDLIEGYLETVK